MTSSLNRNATIAQSSLLHLNGLAGHEICCRSWYSQLIAKVVCLRLRRTLHQVARKAMCRPVGIEVQAFIESLAYDSSEQEVVVARRVATVPRS
jgi:hypothetical protein